MKKTETHARFGTYFVGLEHLFITEVPLGNISALPQMREVQYTWILENHKRLYGVAEDAPEAPDEAEPDRDTNALAKIEQKPQPVEKKCAPTKASKPVGDAHTGEHTEPAKTWGSKQ